MKITKDSTPQLIRGRFLPTRTWRILLFLVVFVIITFILFSYSGKSTKSLPLLKFKPVPMPIDSRCVREVLSIIKLPKSRSSYTLELLQDPLPITNLSAPCRSFLTPQPPSAKRRKEIHCFLPQVWFQQFQPHDYDRIRDALRVIEATFRKAKVPLVLDSGTALGSWRMHGQIPYDPDIDFFVHRHQKDKAVRIMKRLQRTHPALFNAYYHSNNFWRLDLTRPNKSRLFQIDIFFHKLIEEKMIIQQVMPPSKLHVRHLLPLVHRPFEGVLFPTFRNMRLYIPQLYGWSALTECVPHTWVTLHFDMHCPTRRVDCSELNYFFNFVHRWHHPDGNLVEILFNRTHALQVFYSPEGI